MKWVGRPHGYVVLCVKAFPGQSSYSPKIPAVYEIFFLVRSFNYSSNQGAAEVVLSVDQMAATTPGAHLKLHRGF